MEHATLVIDIGTSTTLAGYGGESEPAAVLSTILGKPRNSYEYSNNDFCVGSNVIKMASQYSVRYPIENRLISDFDDFTCFLSTIFSQQLNCPQINTHPILLTLSPFEPTSTKETVLQIIMETFKAPAFYPASTAEMVLYSSGITSGIVIDSGEAGTYAMPVFECYSIPYYSGQLDIGGRHVTDQIKKALQQRGYSLNNEKDILNDLKSQICYITPDPTQNLQDAPTKTFTAPDGTEVKLASQAYLCPEILFRPMLCNVDQPGTSEIASKVISSIDDDIRDILANHIVLAGGSTLFPGYADRLSKDLTSYLPEQKTHIISDPNRIISTWVGGSILSSLSTFPKLYISKDEYEENGASILPLKMY